MQKGNHLLTSVPAGCAHGHHATPCALTLAVGAMLASAVAPVGVVGAQAIQQPQSKLDRVVITATRIPEDINTTIRDVSVLDGATLRDAGVIDLQDALRLLPGVELSATGPGATPAIFLRGANSNQTLLLVDGQRVSSSYSGLSALQHINVDQIDRIEVLRGPAASLYGADAVGGVIQIFTRRDRGVGIRATAGEWRSQQLSANAGLGNAANGVTVTAAQSASRGYNAIVNKADYSYNPDRDGYRFNTVQLNGNWSPSSSLKLALHAFETRGNAQYDGDASHDDRVRSLVNNIAATAEFLPSTQWTSLLRIGSATDKSSFESAYPGNYKTRNDQFGWQNSFRVGTTLNLLGAFEWRREVVSGSDVLPVTTRRTGSVLLGGDWTADDLRANATVRIDDSSQYGSRSTANGSLGYRLSPQWRAVLSAGTSFKAPTFNDLYYPGYANPNLKPERGQNVELGLRWSAAGSNASLTAYQNNVRDLIQFECDANYNCAPQNVAKARLQGVTLAGSTQFGLFRIDGSVDLVDPRNTTTDTLLARRAREHGAVKLSGDVLGVTTGIELLASGKRFDNASNSRALPGYAVLNVHASKQLRPGVRVGLRIENAADHDYQLAYGYATGGRRAWLTLAIDR